MYPHGTLFVYSPVLLNFSLTDSLLLRRSEVLRSLRHYLWAQSQGHHAIDCLELVEERDVERGSARQSSLKGRDERGPSSIRRTLEPFQRQHWGNFRETGCSPYWLFWVHRYHLELNWTVSHGLHTPSLFSFPSPPPSLSDSLCLSHPLLSRWQSSINLPTTPYIRHSEHLVQVVLFDVPKTILLLSSLIKSLNQASFHNFWCSREQHLQGVCWI